jgi:serine/threonine-protein kinase
MTLSAGTRLGIYEISSALGAGGMGEVYRARDTKLGRDVALKILPDSFAHDPERLARFKREAQVLAALNHPHIGAIYGLEESPSASSGQAGTQFLVLELVEGGTLAQRLEAGGSGPGRPPSPATSRQPLALDEALAIARQIADALDAAHEKGIIHRDLKPANIALTANDQVKVLDFGLAKALGAGGASESGGAGGENLTHSPTLTMHATQAGVILGTAAYMSPEQAKGRAADKRSDVWAFGCVLFEMLTGKKPFEGEDVSDTLAAVLRAGPDWTALPATTPPYIRTLLRRCLQKDPQRRIPHIGIARIEIDEGPAIVESLASAERPGKRANPWLRTAPWAIAAIAAAVAAWLAFRPAPAVPPHAVTRFPVVLPPNTVLNIGANQGSLALALSPDGSRLAYTASAGSSGSQLYVRASDQVEPMVIRGTEGARNPFFSPDGQWIGFNTTDGKLKKVPVGGGAALTICDAVALLGATWLPDDSIVFTPSGGGSNGGLWRVSAGGGAPTELAKRDPKTEASFRWPEVLPGGKAILFTIQRPNTDFNSASIAVMRLDTGERKALVEGGTSPHYLPSGHLVYARAGAVLALPFDVRALQVKGVPASVMEGIVFSASQGTLELAVSSAGSAVYMPASETQASYALTWVDRKGGVQPINAPRQNYEFPRLSPDGQRLAVSINGSSSSGLPDVWLYDFSRGTLSRLTSEKEEAETSAWTPDGRRVTYSVSRSPERHIMWKSADGSSAEEALASTDRHLHLGSWSPSGDALVSAATSNGPDAGSLWILQMTPKPTLRSFLKTQFQVQAPAISPDGRWIAYSANDTNRFEVYIQSFPGLGAKYQVSTVGGAEPRWASKGRELFFRNGDKMMAVTIQNTGDSLHIGTPTVLFEGRFRDTYYDVSPDGQRFLMLKAAETQSTSAMVMIQDWATELKQRVPIK